MTADPVLEALRGVCEDRARPATETDHVAGVAPEYVVAPASTEETAAVVRLAAEHRLCVVARGAGTKQDWGRPPERVDLVVETRGMDRLVEHAAGDLIAVAGAGLSMGLLQEQLAKADQQVALDTPFPEATLGGTVAANTSGPRRLLYGTMRDLLIGITFVRADGVVAKAGGKVVKNVAGYDFGKLLTGSFGTLGVITEVVLRLHPVLAAQRFVTATYPDPAAARDALAQLLAAQIVPAAVEVEQPAAGPSTVAVLLEGVAAGIDVRAEGAQRLLGSGAEAAERTPDWFGRYPFRAGDVALKITCTLTGVVPVLTAARELGVAVRGSASGVLYATTGPGEPGAAVSTVTRLREVAARYDGHLVVLTAPPELRDVLDVWGPVPGLDLMRRLKRELDPDRILAPGRFVGGI